MKNVSTKTTASKTANSKVEAAKLAEKAAEAAKLAKKLKVEAAEAIEASKTAKEKAAEKEAYDKKVAEAEAIFKTAADKARSGKSLEMTIKEKQAVHKAAKAAFKTFGGAKSLLLMFAEVYGFNASQKAILKEKNAEFYELFKGICPTTQSGGFSPYQIMLKLTDKNSYEVLKAALKDAKKK